MAWLYHLLLQPEGYKAFEMFEFSETLKARAALQIRVPLMAVTASGVWSTMTLKISL